MVAVSYHGKHPYVGEFGAGSERADPTAIGDGNPHPDPGT